MYISKGMVARPSTEELLFVTRCGVEFRLTGIEADLWLDGRFSFAYEKTEEQKKHLQHLARMNLVEYREETSELAQYQILTQCVLCQTKPKLRFSRLSTKEKELLEWICHAGLHLSVAELVYLNEKGIRPSSELLYSYNRQKLTETIYFQNNIQDNILEVQMEKAATRDETIKNILSLLKKKRILLL